MLTAPANVEVAVVEVAVMYPTVGDPVAAKVPVGVQKAIVFGEPTPPKLELPTQLPAIEKQPLVRLIPWANVEVPLPVELN